MLERRTYLDPGAFHTVGHLQFLARSRRRWCGAADGGALAGTAPAGAAPATAGGGVLAGGNVEPGSCRAGSESRAETRPLPTCPLPIARHDDFRSRAVVDDADQEMRLDRIAFTKPEMVEHRGIPCDSADGFGIGALKSKMKLRWFSSRELSMPTLALSRAGPTLVQVSAALSATFS
jgi:hypothetical protein